MEKAKRKISTAKVAYDKLYYYGEIYRPYLNLNCRFEVDNTQELSRLTQCRGKGTPQFRHQTIKLGDTISRTFTSLESRSTSSNWKELEPCRWEDTAAWDALTINTLIERTAERVPNKTALQIKQEGYWQRFTYKDLQEAAQK